jgi:protein-S-isoprenylcysteine O-methyltransferase Ste14
MKRTLSFAYGATAYLLFLGAFLYLAAFTMNLVPMGVSGKASVPPGIAVLLDTALIMMFGVQHTVMARSGFKRWWTQIVPPHLERSTFVLVATCTLGAIVIGWQPIEGDIWNVTGPAMFVLYGISALGFLTIPAVSFLTDHFHLFGLRQVYEYALGRPASKPVFRERGVYRKVRHPMMIGFLIAFWATPHMTIGHLFLATLMTAYILTGIYFEERGLVEEHGRAYMAYQARVPKLVPTIGSKTAIEPTRLRTATNVE